MKIITIFNQKGGVGKSTTTINLSAALAKKGFKVLVIDNDPQGNTTSGLGVDKESLETELYDVIIDDANMNEAVVKTDFDNLYLVPSSISLAGAEIEIISLQNRESIIKRKISELIEIFDYVFIDCPPSLGLLSINALVASDSIVIPIQCEYYALEGVGQLLNTYKLVKKSLNNNLEIEGVVLTMFDSRTNLSIQVVEEVKKYFKGKVYPTFIPRNIRVAEAPSHGMPVIYYAEKSKGSEAYLDLADNFIEMESN